MSKIKIFSLLNYLVLSGSVYAGPFTKNEEMAILTALAIHFGERPDLYERMREAVEKINRNAIPSDKFFCAKTIQALRILKAKERP